MELVRWEAVAHEISAAQGPQRRDRRDWWTSWRCCLQPPRRVPKLWSPKHSCPRCSWPTSAAARAARESAGLRLERQRLAIGRACLLGSARQGRRPALREGRQAQRPGPQNFSAVTRRSWARAWAMASASGAARARTEVPQASCAQLGSTAPTFAPSVSTYSTSRRPPPPLPRANSRAASAKLTEKSLHAQVLVAPAQPPRHPSALGAKATGLLGVVGLSARADRATTTAQLEPSLPAAELGSDGKRTPPWELRHGGVGRPRQLRRLIPLPTFHQRGYQ